MVNALHRGRYGECYIASGRNLNYREAFELIADTLGVHAPDRRISDFLIDTLGFVGSFFARVSGHPPFLSCPMARISHAEAYYSKRKAVEELGMPQSDLKVAIRECFSWLKEHGYVHQT